MRFQRAREALGGRARRAHESVGRKIARGGANQSNAHLKRAFPEAAVLYLRHATGGKKLLARLERKRGKGTALSILARGTVSPQGKFANA